MNIIDDLTAFDGSTITDQNVIRDGLVMALCLAIIIIIILLLGN